ncbi:MAG: ISNCY family transposase [Clostridia bacterium]|nr:ISNCY family transposase [Deltaproteobacteria bacterium]
MSVTDAARLVGLSVRQARRVCRSFEAIGSAGLAHGNARRPPSNRIADATRALIVEQARTTYVGFNDHHLTEMLNAHHALGVSRASVQRILRSAGLASPRKRRGRKHRMRRERRGRAGELLLWDGSTHDWLEGRGPLMCLIGAIDDATGALMPGAHFVPNECAVGYLRVLLATINAHGAPLAIYMDRHGIFRRTDDHWTHAEQLAGEQDLTQVGCAMRELGIEPIFALSPQAKGRVERLWGTLQDRLVSEMRLANIATLEAANTFIASYVVRFNGRFAQKAAQKDSAFRPLKKMNLAYAAEEICAFRIERKVRNDNTVQTEGCVIEIPAHPSRATFAGATVQLRQLLDGTWRVFAHDVRIAELTKSAPSKSPPRNKKVVKIKPAKEPKKIKLTFKQTQQRLAKEQAQNRTESLSY